MNAELNPNFLKNFSLGDKAYQALCITSIVQALEVDAEQLPITIKVLFENVARHTGCDLSVLKQLAEWKKYAGKATVPYHPARVLMQDFTGVPAIVDLAAMRDAMLDRGGDPEKINPRCAVDLVIDHSVTVEHYGQATALAENTKLEKKQGALPVSQMGTASVSEFSCGASRKRYLPSSECRISSQGCAISPNVCRW